MLLLLRHLPARLQEIVSLYVAKRVPGSCYTSSLFHEYTLAPAIFSLLIEV